MNAMDDFLFGIQKATYEITPIEEGEGPHAVTPIKTSLPFANVLYILETGRK